MRCSTSTQRTHSLGHTQRSFLDLVGYQCGIEKISPRQQKRPFLQQNTGERDAVACYHPDSRPQTPQRFPRSETRQNIACPRFASVNLQTAQSSSSRLACQASHQSGHSLETNARATLLFNTASFSCCRHYALSLHAWSSTG